MSLTRRIRFLRKYAAKGARLGGGEDDGNGCIDVGGDALAEPSIGEIELLDSKLSLAGCVNHSERMRHEKIMIDNAIRASKIRFVRKLGGIAWARRPPRCHDG